MPFDASPTTLPRLVLRGRGEVEQDIADAVQAQLQAYDREQTAKRAAARQRDREELARMGWL